MEGGGRAEGRQRNGWRRAPASFIKAGLGRAVSDSPCDSPCDSPRDSPMRFQCDSNKIPPRFQCDSNAIPSMTIPRHTLWHGLCGARLLRRGEGVRWHVTARRLRPSEENKGKRRRRRHHRMRKKR